MIKSRRLRVMISLILSVLVPVLLLAACSERYVDKTTNKLFFKGESANWEGVIIEEFTETWREGENGKITYENTVRERLALKYKEEDYSNVVITGYDYKDSAGCGGGGSGSIHLDQYGYVQLDVGGGKNISITRENDLFTLSISWSEKNSEPRRETLELRAVNKSVPPAKLHRYLHH